MKIVKDFCVLSLDLDWFNFLPGKSSVIYDFFKTLSIYCSLPSTVYVLEEHHYLMPFILYCSEKFAFAPNINIINIDEHHDFYNLEFIDFSKSSINCGNFFAFMVHHDLLQDYTWICNEKHSISSREDLTRNISYAKDKKVKKFCDSIHIYGRDEVKSVIERKKIDQIVVVKSSRYTLYKKMNYPTTCKCLRTTFSDLRRYKHRKEFLNYKEVIKVKKIFNRPCQLVESLVSSRK